MSGPIRVGGERLRVFLDGSHVETRWIAGYHVIWQTGQRNGPPQGDPAHHTHCSAYAAAVALDLDIYLLRPPHHGQERLANAQVEWLGGSGNYSGPSASRSRGGVPWGIAVATVFSITRSQPLMPESWCSAATSSHRQDC